MNLSKNSKLFDNQKVKHTQFFVDANELARILSLSVHTIRKWKAKGQIPYRKFGRSIRYDVDEVVQAISSRR